MQQACIGSIEYFPRLPENVSFIGRHSNASDYVRDLIRRDQERSDKLAELQRLITEGLKSGVSDHSKEDILKVAREQLATSRGLIPSHAGSGSSMAFLA